MAKKDEKTKVEEKDKKDEKPVAPVETKTDTTLVKQAEEYLVFKASRPLTEREFGALSNILKREQEKTGLKILLAPYSVDLIEGS